MSADHGARSAAPARLARYVPVISWAPGYRLGWLRGDAIAGFTIWGLLIPEGIAYAGLPPQAGLYTLLASLVLYAVFGTSRQLVVAGTSASTCSRTSAAPAGRHSRSAPSPWYCCSRLIGRSGCRAGWWCSRWAS